MKRNFILILTLFANLASWACTSAIVSGRLTQNGHPLMWKNRDTNDQNNRVERIKAHDGLYEFVAIFDSRDTRDSAAWTGFNERGFAIMNTASYNLNHDELPESEMDKEGVVMRRALETCATVADFERLLTEWHKPMGVEANFGVIDADGNAAYFETGNMGFKKYDLADEPTGIITRTNYSYSGREGEGWGYIRERNEKHLLAPHIAAADITPAVFTEELSRTFYHDVLGEDFSMSGRRYVVDQDFIPRRISTATIVIEGVLKGEDPSLTTMWIGIGYPPCSEIRACWTGEGGVPEELQGTGPDRHSPLCDEINRREEQVFNIKPGNGKCYIDLSSLYNAEGTGWCQILREKNRKAYEEGYRKLQQRRNKR